jgi:hypothetical protein
MSFSFPGTQYFRILDNAFSSGEVKGGYFNLSAATDIENMMLTIFIRGSLGGSEQIRARIYGNSESIVPICNSSWASLSGIGSYSGNWIGNVYVDFANQPLNPNIDYYVGIQAQNYTRNLDTFYIGVNLDWVDPVNTQLLSTKAGARMRILGER